MKFTPQFTSLVALTLVIAFSGCQSTKKKEKESTEAAQPASARAETVSPSNVSGEPALVTTDAAPFYRYGPAQAAGPDLRLPKSTVVQVTKKGKAYSSVRLQSGMAGFMITRDLTFGDEVAQMAAQLAQQSQPPRVINQSRPTVKYTSTARVADAPAPQSTPQSNAPDVPLPDDEALPADAIDPITPSTEDVKFPAFRY